MMRFTLTQSFLWKRGYLSFAALLLSTFFLSAQSIGYSCECGEGEEDGYIYATIIIDSDVSGEAYFISNVSNLYPFTGASNPYADGYQLVEQPAGSTKYIINGFVHDGTEASFDVERIASNGAVTWSEYITMNTCSKGEFSFSGNQDVCVNTGFESYSLTNSLATSHLEDVEWLVTPEDGAIVSLPVTNFSTTSADISWIAPGDYKIIVRGNDRNVNCEFEEEYEVSVRAFDASISGPTSLCEDQANQLLRYTYSSENLNNDDNIIWEVTGGDAIINATGDDYEVDIDFTDGTTAGNYVVRVTGDSGDCSVNEELSVEVVETYTFDFSDGSTYVCEETMTEFYKLDLPLGTSVSGLWTVTDTDSPGSTEVPVLIMGGSPDEVTLDFATAVVGRSYTLEISGLIDQTNCPYNASKEIFYAENDTEAIACNGQVNLSMNLECDMEFKPKMILQGLNVNNDAYDVVLTYPNGDILDDNIILADHIGMTFQVMILQECGENSCWGYVLVEDKTIPSLDPYCTAVDQRLIYECEDLDFDPELPNNLGFPDFSGDPDIIVTYVGGDEWELDGYDNCGLASLSFEDTADYMCNDEEILVTRVWTATDINSGTTSTCSVQIRVAIADEDDIVWPVHWDTRVTPQPGTLEACDDSWIERPDGTPDPSYTGIPYLPLCSKFWLDGFEDVIIPICGDKAMKILRKWTVIDECGSNGVIEHTQIITIMDTQEPICVAPPDDQVVYADKHNCTIDTLFFFDPQIVTDCSDYVITVMYKLRDPNTGLIPSEFESLPPGQMFATDIDASADTIWVNYLVEDVCGNVTGELGSNGQFNGGCLYEIAIKDNTQPTPVCDLYSTVSLNNDGCAYAWPSTFDDYSIDNCSVYEKVIRRMDYELDPCECEENYPEFDFARYLGKYNDHHYYLSHYAVTGPQAFNYSNAVGAYPVMTGDMDENDWVNSQVRLYTNEPYFIGLRAETTSNTVTSTDYQWNNGSTNPMRNWAGGQPTNPFLSGLGEAYVYADTNGEWYAEKESRINAFYVFEVEDPCSWTQEIKFCCDDLTRPDGDPLMVQMRVIDHSGNHNFCMVEVDVIDLTPPVLQAPRNITVDCDENVDSIIMNTPVYTSPQDSVCGVDVTMTMTSKEYECETGQKRITFTATDAAGNTSTDTWVVTISNLTPFEGDIDYPDDIVLQTTSDLCTIKDIDPVELGPGFDYPDWENDDCSNVTASFEDQVYHNVDGACMKVIRTWSVIDWCQSGRLWTYNQTIKLVDDVAPTFFGSTCKDLVFSEAASPNCLVDVGPIIGTATDNCTSENALIWSYELKLEGQSASYGNGNSISGPFPIGEHHITWTVEDHCGNITTCSKKFTVTDSKPPIAYCLDLVVTSLDPYSEQAVIWASDLVRLDSGTFECNGDVDYSFSSTNPNDNYLELDCDDIENGIKDTIYVDVFFTDGSGNQSFCTAGIILQDNSDICPDDPSVVATRGMIAGHVFTELDRMIDNVDIKLNSVDPEFPQKQFTIDGGYLFSDIKMYENYNVSAYKSDHYLNGVSTLDIVYIQKHILGLQSLDSPYKLIAADANNSETVSAIDLIELRKLILGIYDELPSNDSWRFVDASFRFPDEANPWPFSEEIDLNDISTDYMDADFIGIKVGDVNESVDPNLLDNETSTDSRSAQDFELSIKIEEGSVLFISNEDASIVGTQFRLRFDQTELNVNDVFGDKLELTQNNFNKRLLGEGVLAMSWNDIKTVEIKQGDVLFSLQLEDALVGENSFSIMKDPVQAEVYILENGTISTSKLKLRNTNAMDDGFEVYQNRPNPFTKESTIGFKIGESTDVQLRITDFTGRLIYSVNRYFEEGYNEFYIKQNLINTTGILYYQLSTNKQTISKKMVVLN